MKFWARNGERFPIRGIAQRRRTPEWLNLNRTGSATYDLPDKRIAYFSLEIAFDPAMPTYSGGLRILAGDTLCTAAEQAPK
jgi:glucan phosphorylase